MGVSYLVDMAATSTRECRNLQPNVVPLDNYNNMLLVTLMGGNTSRATPL